jgi:hypothetical protein
MRRTTWTGPLIPPAAAGNKRLGRYGFHHDGEREKAHKEETTCPIPFSPLRLLKLKNGTMKNIHHEGKEGKEGKNEKKAV